VTPAGFEGKIMIYVNDDENGRIDICELNDSDREYIIRLLHGKLDRTNNPTIMSKARLLVVDLNSINAANDFELGWSDVFLLSSLLLNELVGPANQEVKDQAERILEAFESAAASIIE